MSKFANAVIDTSPPARQPIAGIITGRPGIGKTFFISTIPRVFIIPIENGLEGASKDHDPGCFKDTNKKPILPSTYAEFKEAISAFVARNKELPEAERFKHLAVDGLTGLETLINNETTSAERVAHMDAKEFGVVYGAAMPRWQEVQRIFNKLREHLGIHVWIVAHSAETREATIEGDQFAKWDLHMSGAGQKLAALRTMWRGWADNVLFIDWDAKVTKGSIGKKSVGRYEARILRTRETPSHFAKNRYGMAPVLPCTWQDLEKALKAGASASPEKTLRQLESVVAQLPAAEQAAIRADMKTAKTATAMAAVLSRAQGILSVLTSEQDDEEQATAKSEAKHTANESFLDDVVGPTINAPQNDEADSEPIEPEPASAAPEDPFVEIDDSEVAVLVDNFTAAENRSQYDHATKQALDIKEKMNPLQYARVKAARAAASARLNISTKAA